eukprot:UN22240
MTIRISSHGNTKDTPSLKDTPPPSKSNLFGNSKYLLRKTNRKSNV